MSLLSVGTIAFDDVKTPHGHAERIVGGSLSYIVLAATNYPNTVQLVSVVGDDFPDAVLQDYQKRGADLAGVQIKEGEKSFFWAGSYHADMNGRDTLETQLNVLADFDPVLPPAYHAAPYVMLGNLTPAVQARVLDQLTARPKLIALDTMNLWMDIALDELKAVLKRIDILIVNDEEARQLSGEHSLVRAAAAIFGMGPKTVIIKKGEHGALLFGEDRVFYAPALPLEQVTDPTGAGDTFAGGFMGYLAATDDTSFDNMKRAILHGSALASFCVEEFGTERLKRLTKQEIDTRVQRFVELVNVEL